MSDSKVLQWPWQKNMQTAIEHCGPTEVALDVITAYKRASVGFAQTDSGKRQCERIAHALSVLTGAEPPADLSEAKDTGSTDEPLKGV